MFTNITNRFVVLTCKKLKKKQLKKQVSVRNHEYLIHNLKPDSAYVLQLKVQDTRSFIGPKR